MTSKIIAALLIAAINAIMGVAVFLFLLVAMNGYSERIASYGLGAFVILGLAVTVSMAIGGFLITGYLLKRGRSPVLAGFLSTVAGSVLGAFLKVVSALVGIGVAEVIRAG
ncbi:MAG TPA: hypothetical protein PKC65_15435 [Pyrinomonadaceae bacterium]|nr:hypothetical protein [Pyrinomonadaceae bacterium]